MSNAFEASPQDIQWQSLELREDWLLPGVSTVLTLSDGHGFRGLSLQPNCPTPILLRWRANHQTRASVGCHAEVVAADRICRQTWRVQIRTLRRLLVTDIEFGSGQVRCAPLIETRSRLSKHDRLRQAARLFKLMESCRVQPLLRDVVKTGIVNADSTSAAADFLGGLILLDEQTHSTLLNECDVDVRFSESLTLLEQQLSQILTADKAATLVENGWSVN